MIRTDLVKKIKLWQKLYPHKCSCDICEGVDERLCQKLRALYVEKYENVDHVGDRCVVPFLNDEDFRV
jgi:hypothetical protein